MNYNKKAGFIFLIIFFIGFVITVTGTIYNMIPLGLIGFFPLVTGPLGLIGLIYKVL